MRVHTRSGFILSAVLFGFSIFFIIAQLIRFIIPSTYRDLNLMTELTNDADVVNISMNLLVDQPCYFLHLDQLDSIGTSQLEINNNHTVRMIRYSQHNQEIGIANETVSSACHPCYGVKPDGFCCNSCEELVLLYQVRGLKPTPEKWPQCQRGKVNVNPHEKCRFKGKISVNKVSGSFHIGLGANVKSQNGQHIHSLNFQFPSLRLSHTISAIRFGPKIPNTKNPLLHITLSQPHSNIPMTYQYNLLVSPVTYKKGDKIITKGYEYHSLIASSFNPMGGTPPGIFFRYSFTPYGITVTAKQNSVAMFVTTTSGLLVGIYSLTMLFDIAWYRKQTAAEMKIAEKAAEEAKRIVSQ